MSLTKGAAQAMEYELSGSKKVNSKGVMRKAYRKAVSEQSSVYTLGLLAYKHRVGILALGSSISLLNWAFPMWTELVKSVI